MEAIEQAIIHGIEAGKLRIYVRENGGELRGLERLADRHTSAATAALTNMLAGSALAGRPPSN